MQSGQAHCRELRAHRNCFDPLEPSSCNSIFSGTQPEHAPCFAYEECASGLHCNRELHADACGTCEVDARLVETNLELDMPCEINAPPYCRGGLVCAGQGQTARCQEPGGEGMACGPLHEGKLRCEHRFRCLDGVCTRVVFRGLGDTCDVSRGIDCRDDGYCSRSDGVCVVRPTTGETCTSQSSDSLGYCENEICAAVRPAGSTCEHYRECADDFDCLESCGIKTCQPYVAWRECS